MTDKKLTDKEIIEGLERCISTTTDAACEGCPFNKQNLCDIDKWALEKYALNLINRQKTEIERLNKKVGELSDVLSDTIRIRYAEAKSEAYKEFAEKLKEEALPKCDWDDCVDVEDIDKLLKEMIGN